MESDLYDVMLACTEGRLAETPVSFTPGAAAATVVLAADGYPGKYPKGMPISGLEDADAIPGVTVYHAGTKAAAPAPSTGTDMTVSDGDGGGVVSSGGRVLAVTGMGSTFAEALDAAYRGVGVVKFSPCHYRKDIGHRAKTAPLRVGVLASGRGTALQAVIDACEAGAAAGGVNAEVVLVVTNKKEAPVRERAKKHGIPEIFVSSKVSYIISYAQRCWRLILFLFFCCACLRSSTFSQRRRKLKQATTSARNLTGTRRSSRPQIDTRAALSLCCDENLSFCVLFSFVWFLSRVVKNSHNFASMSRFNYRQPTTFSRMEPRAVSARTSTRK